MGEAANEFLAAAHERANRHTVSVDIRTGNVGRPAGVVWVETKTALAALDEAATRIAELEAQVARLREALELWLEYDDQDEADFTQAGPILLYARAIDATRAALSADRATDQQTGKVRG